MPCGAASVLLLEMLSIHRTEDRVVRAPDDTGSVTVSLSIDSEPWFDVGEYTYEALGRGASGCHIVQMAPAMRSAERRHARRTNCGRSSTVTM